MGLEIRFFLSKSDVGSNYQRQSHERFDYNYSKSPAKSNTGRHPTIDLTLQFQQERVTFSWAGNRNSFFSQSKKRNGKDLARLAESYITRL